MAHLTPDEYDELCRIFVEVDESGYELRQREYEFFETQRQHLERYRREIYLSAPQWQWLRDIHQRATE